MTLRPSSYLNYHGTKASNFNCSQESCSVVKLRVGKFGHLRRAAVYIYKGKLPGKGEKGRPKRRFIDVVRDDMKEGGASETDA